MSIFYEEVHTTCYNHELPTNATFKVLEFAPSNKTKIIEVDRSVIIFLLEGKVQVSCNSYRDKIHQKGQIALLPRNSSCYIKILEYAVVVSCSYVQSINFCDRLFFMTLQRFLPVKFNYDFCLLPITERIMEFVVLIKNCLNDNLGCLHFHELSSRKMLILFRAYYPKEELAAFFYPLLGKELDFKDFVLANFLEVKDLTEFADLANLSIDTFKRRFKETFDMPAHKWIAQRKSEFIYRDLIASSKSFADIAMQYNLSSQAYLSTFCKRFYEKTPQEIRNSSL